jgi:hypothetical protein
MRPQSATTDLLSQSKVIASVLMHAYNGMVISLRQYRAQEVKGGLGKGGQLPVGR